jgi:hypothetical protein
MQTQKWIPLLTKINEHFCSIFGAKNGGVKSIGVENCSQQFREGNEIVFIDIWHYSIIITFFV